MGDLTKQTTINAPIAGIFKFAADPHNAPGYVSSIKRIISGPTDNPSVGQTWQAEANFLGRDVQVTVRLTDLVEPQLVRFVLEGEPQSIMTLRLAQDDNPSQTRVSLTLEVPSVPTILLNGLMGGLLAGDVERLKGRMET